jgi:hypothetical protein
VRGSGTLCFLALQACVACSERLLAEERAGPVVPPPAVESADLVLLEPEEAMAYMAQGDGGAASVDGLRVIQICYDDSACDHPRCAADVCQGRPCGNRLLILWTENEHNPDGVRLIVNGVVLGTLPGRPADQIPAPSGVPLARFFPGNNVIRIEGAGDTAAEIVFPVVDAQPFEDARDVSCAAHRNGEGGAAALPSCGVHASWNCDGNGQRPVEWHVFLDNVARGIVPGDECSLPIDGVASEFPELGIVGRNSAGINAIHEGCPAVVPCAVACDCNGNQIEDGLEASLYAADANGNGIRDICETAVEIRQVSYADPQGGYYARYSSALVNLTLPQPTEGTIPWFNLVIGERWVVQNMPIIPATGIPGEPHMYTAFFDLGAETGTPVDRVNVTWRLSLEQSAEPPPGTPNSMPVEELDFHQGLLDLDEIGDPGPFVPEDVKGFVNPSGPGPWDTVARRGVEMLQEELSHCAPGAAARSLDWLRDAYRLDFGPDFRTAGDIYGLLRQEGYMSTDLGSGTRPSNIAPGVQRFIAERGFGNGLGIALPPQMTPADIFLALEAGKDILAAVVLPRTGHAFAITGAVRCDDEYTIFYRDDQSQLNGGLGDSSTKAAKVTRTSPVTFELNGWGRAVLAGVLLVCPSRLIQACALEHWLNGQTGERLPPGLREIEGALPLIDVLLQDPPDPEIVAAAHRESLASQIGFALDVAGYLVVNVRESSPPGPALECALAIFTKIRSAFNFVQVYLAGPSQNRQSLESARDLLSEIAADLAELKRKLDGNQNGTDDLVDIAMGRSRDTNRNSIPDDLEVRGLVSSLCERLPGDPGACSGFGVLTVAAIEPPVGEIAWLNAEVDGRLVVENAPLLTQTAPGNVHDYSIPFDLGIAPGEPLGEVDLSLSVTVDMQTGIVAPGFAARLPVVELDWSLGLVSSPDSAPGTFFRLGIPVDFRNPAGPGPWDAVVRQGVPSVQERENHCAPGAAARSLAWLRETYCLDFGAGLETGQEIFEVLRGPDYLMTSEETGTPGGKITSGLEAFLAANGNEDRLEVASVSFATAAEVHAALAAGKDTLGQVVRAEGVGHAFTITGAVRCGEEYSIHYRDDEAQGSTELGDRSTKTARFTRDDLVLELSSFGEEVAWSELVTVSPTRWVQLSALQKWLSGDASAGVEGVIPLLERLSTDPAGAGRDELLLQLARAEDVSSYLRRRLEAEGGGEAALAAATLEDMVEGARRAIEKAAGPTEIGEALAALAGVEEHWASLEDLFDCNRNGIDDRRDIVRGRSLDADGSGIPDECEGGGQIPGDCNQDGNLAIGDAICLFGFLFRGTPTALPCGEGAGAAPGNVALVDCNGDGRIDLSDGICVLGFLFLGSAPPALGTECVGMIGCPESCEP